MTQIKLKTDKDASGLYKSQIDALSKLSDWWNSTEKECLVEGFAGTGKTFLVKYFLENVVNKTHIITAPTHKALTVLEKHINSKGMTLQSLHGLRPNTELSTFDIDKLEFESIGSVKIQNYSLVIIDESSMINNSLFTLNRQRANEFNVKILYLGDRYQLPPIKEKIGKVFTDIKTVIKLNTIIRQDSNNPMLKLFTLLRKDIDNCTSTALEYISKYPTQIHDGMGYSYLSNDDYRNTMIDYFKKDEFYSNVDFVRATSYTNISVSLWNKFIRERIFQTQNKSLIIDDLLTAYKTLVDDNNNPIIINSQDYIIEQIRPYRNEFKLDVNCVVLKSMYNGKLTEMLQIIDSDSFDNMEHYKNILNKLRNNAKKIGGKKGWFPFFKFKNNILAMLDSEIDGAYIAKELDYGYCLTSHKLQGSTFDNIFVDGFDICNPINKWGKYGKTDIEFRNRLLYVALSRAKNMAFIKF